MEVIVTTFLNPHKFWVFEVNNLNQRNRLERRLAHGDFPRISAPSLGQLALVYKETKWHRALVLSETAPFSCWLVDYGVDHTADSVYEILPEFACTPPLTKKASLNDVVGLHRDCTPTGVQNVGEITFSPGSKKRTNDYLGTAEKVLFTCVKEIGNTHVGEITIITSKISLELSEILIKEQVLIRDPIMFSKAFKMNGDAKEFALLKTSPCNPKMSHDHFDNEPFLGVGRGCSRTSQHTLSPNRSVLSSSEIDDNVKDSPYSDSDLISSSSQLSNNTHLSDNNPKRLTIKKKLEEFLANKSAEVETNSLGNGEVSGLNNELEETTSSQENHESRELMRKHLLNNCSCEQCLGWSEGNFYYNARKKINEVKMKNHRPVKPELLLKTEETSGVPVKIKSSYSSHCGKIERSVKPTVLVHSTTVLTPATSITAAPFHKDIHKALRSYEHVYSIQGYVWPAVMRHLNICIIGKRNSGKTLAYLPGICSFELERQERYSDLPKRTVSPISLLLCPGIEVAEKVYHLVLKLLKDASQKSYVALAVPPVDKYSLNQFEKRVDILVATPVTLLSLLSSRIITLKRLCHLVIEKANVVLERFKKETEEVLNVVQSMLSHRNCNYTVQMILTSEKWTYSIENLSKSLHITPIVCISSYLEAAMYGRVDINVQFLEGKAKIGALIKILKGKSDICRSIVICNTDDEIKEVKQYLLIAGINCLYITEDMEMVEINNIESAWQKTIGGKHLALFCTENVFSCNITITSAVMLINYSLPDTWSEFINRFRCMIENYTSPLVSEANVNWTRCTAYSFMDETCVRQFPKVVQLMKRLGGKLPQEFLNYYEKTLEDVEAKKLALGISVCTKLKLFGKCELSSCEMRHILSKKVDYCSNLPKNGTIKFRVAQIYSVNSFGIKILEVKDVDGNLCQWQLYDNLQEELNDTLAKKKQCVFDVDVGAWYAYHALKDNVYLRCSVLKITHFEQITKRAMTVSIHCLDTGAKFDVSSTFLYKLPPQFNNIPPQVIDVYLANVVPTDSDDTWSHYCKSKVESLLTDANYDEDDAFLMGRILLQLTNNLWLENMIVYQTLETSDLEVIKLNLRKVLLQQGIANVNENSLHLLYNLCKKSDIVLPSYALNVEQKTINRQPQPQWAHLDDSDCIQVFISYVESPSLFYLRIVRFYDVFEDFQEEIQKNLQKPFYPEVGEIFTNKCCLVKDAIGGDFARCIVTEVKDEVVKVFLVDYGNCETVMKSELKHLPDKYITKLPFQAIECRLWGIEPDWDIWDIHAIERLKDLMFEPNESYFRILHANVYKKEEAASTGGLKYAVVIADDFNGNLLVINQVLIDVGIATTLHGEDIGEFSYRKQILDEEEDNDSLPEIEREMTFEEINREQKRHVQNVSDDSSIEAIEGVSDEPVWDIVINRSEGFFKELLNIKDTCPPTTSTSTLPALPAPRSSSLQDHFTPHVIWYQTDTHIKLKIAIPCLEKCEINVIRKNAFIFEGITTSGKSYTLKIFLHDHVLKEFEYKLTGQDCKVSLTKKIPVAWPKLVLGEKSRNISYDYTKYDDEKQRTFLDLGGDHPDEIPDDEEEMVVYTGSEYSSGSDSEEFD